jgi:hypothetical protein
MKICRDMTKSDSRMHGEQDRETRVLFGCLSAGALPPQVCSDLTDPSLSWRKVVDTACRLGLGALLYSRCGEHAVREHMPTQVLCSLKDDYFFYQARNMKVYAELRNVLTAFSHHGLSVIVLKGAALAELVYRHIGLRTMTDIDLLVRKEDLRKAAVIMEELGFRADEHYRSKEWYHHCHHHLAPYISPDGSISVEIHWHVLERTAPMDFAIEELWTRPKAVRVAQTPCLRFSAEHLLFHVALHLASSSQFRSQLRGLCDVAEILRTLEQEIDWQELLRLTVLTRASRYLYVVLRLTTELFGAPIPGAALNQLRRTSRFLPLEESWAVRAGLEALLITDIETRPFYEWVGLDLLTHLLSGESGVRVVLGVSRKVFERCQSRIEDRWRAWSHRSPHAATR